MEPLRQPQNVTTPAVPPPQAQAAPQAQASLQAPPKKTSKKVGPIIFTLIILLLIAGLGAMAYEVKQLNSAKEDLSQKVTDLDKRIAPLEAPTKYVQEQIENDKMQAVFLNGGQVYFGKITHLDASTLTLEDIYYLKDANFDKNETITGTNASLVKLGNELHAPEDKMVIERKNVTFWENLKSDGKVAQAIAAYEKQNK